jgi:radical SAM superfamily enzyme YgiQ (UPF0313 family)
MKAVRIYFGDLTHDTIGLATEVFPLNIGFIAAYCKKVHGDAVDVRLFKYIPQLEDAIVSEPPDILALSNYPWCHNANKLLCQLLHERRPESLRIMGGPNFPHDPPSQKVFLTERQAWLDTYVYLDGEVGFSNIASVALSSNSLSEARERLRIEPLQGCVQLKHDGNLLSALPQPKRLIELDEIPSPYLTGLMEPFFDGRLSPMIQTTRGCPFRCTFCHDGAAAVNRVTEFSLDRVKAEIEYIVDRVPKNVNSLFISDLNFGMYKRDLEICRTIAAGRERVGYPRYIDTTTGKNQKERVIQAVDKLAGALRLTMSVQSMTPQVLKNIKRDNIKLEDFMALEPALRRANLETASEVILGLPGETLDSHYKVLGDLLDAKIDSVVPYTLMMIHGAELSTPAERQKWGLKTKYRIIPRDFTRLRNGRSIVEIEEVAIATNTLSFEDYVEARKMAMLIRWVNNKGFRALLRFLKERKVSIMALLKRMHVSLSGAATDDSAAPAELVRIFSAFKKDTVEELWEREGELEDFFQDAENFKQLVDGVHGKNLIQTYEATGLSQAMREMVDCVFHHARVLFAQAYPDPVDSAKLDQIEQYCRCKSFNLLGADRFDTVPEVELKYDIDAWLADPEQSRLENYELDQQTRVRFILTPQQYRAIENSLEQFGRNPLGLGKTIVRIGPDMMWRNAQVAQTEAAE